MALSDFYGFESGDICAHEASDVVVTQKSSKDKTKTKRGDAVTLKSSGKVKPYASKKGKNKVSKHDNSQQKL